ncbi:hypothetical protein BH09PSE5_BH09PSE5_37190 [soil metagenome]
MQATTKASSDATPRETFVRPETVIRQIQQSSRYFFSAAEFAGLTGKEVGSPSVEKALHRLAKAGVIQRVTRRPSGWLIVPPEQAHYGAPPVSWWLDDCMQGLEPNYYVALLSAARHWGSAHYALQTTQVMVGRPRPALTPGKLIVEFFSKRSLAETPTTVVTTDVAPWRVSTREATLYDLVRHPADIGGLESIVRIAKDLGPELSGDEITKAANAMGVIPAAQRLGFLFDYLKLTHPANRLDEWLSSRRTQRQSLEPGAIAEQDAFLVNERWNVQYSQMQLNVLEEVA